ETSGEGPATGGAGAEVWRAGRGCAGQSPSQRRGPSRPQTGEHHADCGSCELLDFGLAKPFVPVASLVTLTAAKQESPVTEQGNIVGTWRQRFWKRSRCPFFRSNH